MLYGIEHFNAEEAKLLELDCYMYITVFLDSRGKGEVQIFLGRFKQCIVCRVFRQDLSCAEVKVRVF